MVTYSIASKFAVPYKY